MDIETLRLHCLSKPGTTEGFPFGPNVLVFKVMNKMYALIGMDEPTRVNLKCDPAHAIELRERHPEVQPGYHMNKQQWNTVSFLGALTDAHILSMVDDSYRLIAASLPAKTRAELHALNQ
jgi:predicted DNA-binding protein (MmcQ/YjbR family)